MYKYTVCVCNIKLGSHVFSLKESGFFNYFVMYSVMLMLIARGFNNNNSKYGVVIIYQLFYTNVCAINVDPAVRKMIMILYRRDVHIAYFSCWLMSLTYL